MTETEPIAAGGGGAVLAALRRGAANRDAIDLSVPAPDVLLLEPAARRAVAAAMNAAAPGTSDRRPALLDALARHAAPALGYEPAAGEQIVAAPSAAAALAAIVMALLGPGDEVVVVEPAPPERAILLRRAGAVVRPVPGEPAGGLPRASLQSAIGPRTRMVLLPQPGDPGAPETGAGDMAWFCGIAGARTFWTVADGAPAELAWLAPAPPAAASYPNMAGRSLSVGVPLAGRGLPETPPAWIAGPAPAITAISAAQATLGQFVAAATARALTASLGMGAADGIWQGLAARRGRLAAVLTGSGWSVLAGGQGPALVARPPADWPRDDETAAGRLLALAGVMALPLSAHRLGGEPRDLLAFRFDRPSADIERAAKALTGPAFSARTAGA